MTSLRPLMSAVLLLVALSGLWWSGAVYAADGWQVESLRGTVLRYVDDRWVELSSNEVLAAGIPVRTLSGGTAVLISSGARVSLEGATSIRIAERGRSVLVEQFSGTIEVAVARDQRTTFAIRTPSVEISALAGTLIVEVTKTGTTFDVSTGSVSVLDIATGAMSVVNSEQQVAAENPAATPPGSDAASASSGTSSTASASTSATGPDTGPAASVPDPTPAGGQTNGNGQSNGQGSNNGNDNGAGNGNANGAQSGNGNVNGANNGNVNGANNGNGNGAANGNGNGAAHNNGAANGNGNGKGNGKT